jgi:purine nucleosidase
VDLTRRKLLRQGIGAAALLSLPTIPRALVSPSLNVILDTDIGGDIDDAFALALLGSLPGIDIRGVVTADGQPLKRAQIAAKLLHVMGRPGVPVYPGLPTGGSPGRQYDWAKDFSSKSIKSTDPIAFMREEIEKAPGEITLIGIGPLGNLGALFTQFPETAKKVRSVVLMGGAFHVGYNNSPPPVPEFNIAQNPNAARVVFTSGAPLICAGLDVTTMMRLDEDRQKLLFAQGTPLTDALAALTNLWGNHIPVLYDPFAVAYATGHMYCDKTDEAVAVEPNGLTRIVDGPKNATVLVRPQKDAFLDWYVQLLSSGVNRRV